MKGLKFGLISAALIFASTWSTAINAQETEPAPPQTEESFFAEPFEETSSPTSPSQNGEASENAGTTDEAQGAADPLNTENPPSTSAENSESQATESTTQEASTPEQSAEKASTQAEQESTASSEEASMESEFENSEEFSEVENVDPFIQQENDGSQTLSSEPSSNVAPPVEKSERLPKVRRNKVPLAKDPYYQPKKIEHPYAKKGLFYISKDKEYFYRVKRSKPTKSATVRVGTFKPQGLKNATENISFDDIYGSGTNPTVVVDMDWDLWRGFGRLTYGFSFGLFTASGKGRFSPTSVNADLTPPESFTFVAIPVGAISTYYIEFSDRQWFTPYVSGGLNLIGFTEVQADSGSPKFGGSISGHGAAGASISFANFSRMAMIELDREYGISDIRFDLEFRVLAPVYGTYSFSGNLISAGVSGQF